MAPLTAYFVLALGALAAAAPIAQFESVGLGQALERAPQVGAADVRAPGSEVPGPDAREPERGAADRGRPDDERGAADRERPDDERGAANRGRPDDERGAEGRGRGRPEDAAGRERPEPERAADRGQGRADVCAAALTQIKANLGDIGGGLRDLNAEFAGSDQALIELFGAMQTGLRGTQAAALKIEEAVAQGGAAPDAERQIIIKGLGQARDALNRLDSNDQALRARLRQAKSSMRQTIVTGNRILVACGVAQEGGAPTGVVETSTVSVPPAEETGAATSSVVESGVASQTASLTDSALLSATARPTASESAPVAPTAAPQAPPAVGAPEVISSIIAPVRGIDTCPPAATVTVTLDAAGTPQATVTVTVTSDAAAPSGAVPSSEAITSSAPLAAAPSSGVVSSVPISAAPSSEAVVSSASGVASSVVTSRPTAGVALR